MKKSSALVPFAAEPPSGQFHAEAPEDAIVPVSPDPQPEKTEPAAEHSMRWEDDGGPVFDVPKLLPQSAETNTPRRMDAPAG